MQQDMQPSEHVEDQESIIDPIQENEVIEKKRRRELLFELALFFILGFLLGVTIKSEAVKKITIGFNDYQIQALKNPYDIGAMKRELDQEARQQRDQQQFEQQNAPASQPDASVNN